MKYKTRERCTFDTVRTKWIFCQQTDTFTYLPRPESVGIPLDFGVKVNEH